MVIAVLASSICPLVALKICRLLNLVQCLGQKDESLMSKAQYGLSYQTSCHWHLRTLLLYTSIESALFFVFHLHCKRIRRGELFIDRRGGLGKRKETLVHQSDSNVLMELPWGKGNHFIYISREVNSESKYKVTWIQQRKQPLENVRAHRKLTPRIKHFRTRSSTLCKAP